MKAIIAVFAVSVLSAILLGSLALGPVLAAPQEKVDICHADQETGELNTITVGEPAVEKHVANHAGDHPGECFVCGDTFTDPPVEECDDGNTVTEECAYGLTSCTVCAANCTEEAGATSYCGDGTIDDGNGEECDFFGDPSATFCPNCKLPVCGDGHLFIDEECDDGNNNDGDGCDSSCKIELTCEEECEDFRDGCKDLCESECSLDPTPICEETCKLGCEIPYGACLAACEI